jgi:hypothetical protein
MIDDIKEAVDQFGEDVGNSLTSRDRAGIKKIHFELDLLKASHEAQKSSRKKPLKQEEAELLEDD